MIRFRMDDARWSAARTEVRFCIRVSLLLYVVLPPELVQPPCGEGVQPSKRVRSVWKRDAKSPTSDDRSTLDRTQDTPRRDIERYTVLCV